MRKLLRIIKSLAFTGFAFFLFQPSVLANGSPNIDSGLSGIQTAIGFFILIAAILIPTMKSARKANA